MSTIDGADAGKKYDTDKPELHRIPAEALYALAEVFAFGAKKYGDDNWRKGIEPKRLYNAAMRHMLAWNEGEAVDSDSGISHVAHAMCNMAMMVALDKKER